MHHTQPYVGSARVRRGSGSQQRQCLTVLETLEKRPTGIWRGIHWLTSSRMARDQPCKMVNAHRWWPVGGRQALASSASGAEVPVPLAHPTMIAARAHNVWLCTFTASSNARPLRDTLKLRMVAGRGNVGNYVARQ